ncbi:helix-turn-helix domain-containing protein [Gottfriedia acidiceleris]|uniref:AlbA family DNA-binding domain-containing protein n=1 Tax=Gottfriedia acidiceleris TaxID=371036 RepID=UPI000B452033|nr:ATP-binding protein [Gottfriedia acidiceleris]
MKNPWEWTTVADIEELIKNEVQEDLYLDYKQSDSLFNTPGNKKEISKDVSAFANSGGGTLVYGVIEDKATHLPIAIDDGVNPREISKEWLENVITSNIHRKIPDLRINQIRLTSGNVIYVVYVPQSSLAPHMAADKRYYKRYNFKSESMTEYEVRDVGNRFVAPNLMLNIEIQNQPDPLIGSDENYTNQIGLNIYISNESITPATYTAIKLSFDPKINLPSLGGEEEESVYIIEDRSMIMKSFVKHISPTDKPILKGFALKLFGMGFIMRLPKEPGNYYIVSEVSTGGAEPKQFNYKLFHDGSILKIEQVSI